MVYTRGKSKVFGYLSRGQVSKAGNVFRKIREVRRARQVQNVFRAIRSARLSGYGRPLQTSPSSELAAVRLVTDQLYSFAGRVRNLPTLVEEALVVGFIWPIRLGFHGC